MVHDGTCSPLAGYTLNPSGDDGKLSALGEKLVEAMKKVSRKGVVIMDHTHHHHHQYLTIIAVHRPDIHLSAILWPLPSQWNSIRLVGGASGWVGQEERFYFKFSTNLMNESR